MLNFNKIIFIITVIFALLFISTNIFMLNHSNSNNKHHLVEINRVFDRIVNNDDYDLSDCRYVKKVSVISEDSDFDDNDPYVIKTYNSEYIKFTYSNDNSSNQVLIIVNFCIALTAVITISILFYIKLKIIKPFNQVSEMPYTLSKGNLTKNLKEEKSRFFGKFIWGLDMLRETLEQRKMNELALVKEKKMLILSISHDIKTPLSAIKLYTKALSQGLGDSAETSYKITHNADKIESFVNDIIKTSKEDFLNIELINSEFYLSELTGKISDYYTDKLELLKTEFIIQAYDNCLIYGDIERSVEVFQNIIENAIKYGDGKSITIDIKREEDCCLVTVANSGNTLPEEEIVHAFDSFWRGSNAKSQKGSGLGLYICRKILIQMKGDIYIEINGGNTNVTAVLKII